MNPFRGLAAAVDRLVVATDFDGTLAPIVVDPVDARPAPGAVQALQRIGLVAGEVVVLSGRPLEFLLPLLPGDISVIGLYGLESRRRGVRTEHADAARWRPVIERVVHDATLEAPDEVRVETKGLSMTLHHRGHPELAPAVDRLARRLAEPDGLEVRPARMSVEVHPPVLADKGTVLGALLREHGGPAVFLGDDVGDLPAFAALARHRERSGERTLAVAVASDEAPAELLAAADLTVEDPTAAVELLEELAAELGVASQGT